jgi:hypothetical protein
MLLSGGWGPHGNSGVGVRTPWNHVDPNHSTPFETASELKKFNSIEQVRLSLIDREIESVIRLSHQDQFAWIERKLSVKLRENLPVWPKFVEVCERRNLVTHTGGVITEQYIENCKAHGVDIWTIKVGDKLKSDSKYFSEAVATVYELGAKLCHVLWRKFAKEERETADRDLVELGYDLIFVRAYALAEAILRFGVQTLRQHNSDKVRRMMVINLANAIRLQKRESEAKAIVDGEDWSAVGSDFGICVAAVKGDIDKVVELMKEIGRGDSSGAEQYRTWPVFRGMRTDEKFLVAFESIFGEPLFAPKTIEVTESFAEMKEDETRSPDTRH